MRWALALVLATGAAQACEIDPFGQTAYSGSLVVDVATAGLVSRAWFDGPSSAYDHFVLGRETEPTELHVQLTPGGTLCGTVVSAGPNQVFEDVAPRLADMDGDGTNEVIVVRSHVDKGAQLAVYGVKGDGFGLIASTSFIGRKHRWLAPAGIADFDGDGRIEITYVDRPHLARELVFVRLDGDQLIEVARASGFSNHRIGDPAIAGGARICAGGPDLVLATADWTRAVAVALKGKAMQVTDLGPITGPADLQAYMACPG